MIVFKIFVKPSNIILRTSVRIDKIKNSMTLHKNTKNEDKINKQGIYQIEEWKTFCAV